MCGIVGYIGKNNIPIRQLVKNAQFNSYRGNDGIGIIHKNDNGKLDVNKFLYELDEVASKTLSKNRTTKVVRVGSFEYSTYDKERYKLEASKFKSDMTSILNKSSELAFLHHRKATYGADTMENLHPIKINNKYYIHNGTAWGMQSIKSYLEVMMGKKFTSETDTEVISVLYNELLKKYKGDTKQIYETFQEMFTSGWGILIEITEDGKVTVIKDSCRDLWLYKTYDKGIIVISEPTPFLNKFDKVIKLGDGIIEINMKTNDGTDYTEWANKTYNWWKEADDDKKEIKKCDICKTEKYSLSTYHCTGHPQENDRDDRCFQCMVLNTKKVDVDDDWSKQENKKMVYECFLGDKKK